MVLAAVDSVLVAAMVADLDILLVSCCVAPVLI